MKSKEPIEEKIELQQDVMDSSPENSDGDDANVSEELELERNLPSKPSGDVVEVTKILDDDLTESKINEPLEESSKGRGLFGRRRRKSKPSGDVVEVTKLDDNDLAAEVSVAAVADEVPSESDNVAETVQAVSEAENKAVEAHISETAVEENNAVKTADAEKSPAPEPAVPDTEVEKALTPEEEAKAKAKEEVAKIVAKVTSAKAVHSAVSEPTSDVSKAESDIMTDNPLDSSEVIKDITPVADGTINPEEPGKSVIESPAEPVDNMAQANVAEEVLPVASAEDKPKKVNRHEQWRQRHQQRRAAKAEKSEKIEQVSDVQAVVSESQRDISEPEAIEIPVRETGKAPRVKKKLKTSTKVIIIVAAVILAVYIAGIAVGHFLFYPNTYINDVDVSWMNAEESNYILLPHDEYFTVIGRTGEETIKLSDIDYNIRLIHKTKDLIEDQDMFAWPAYFFKDTIIDNACKNSYNLPVLRDIIAKLPSFQQENMIKPQNAYITVDDKGQHSIVEAVEGTQLDTSKASRAIVNAVNGGLFKVDLDEKDCYVKPTIYADDPDLNKTLKTYKALGEETITIDVTGATEVLRPEELLEFVTLENNGSITIKEEVLTKYVTDLAAKYDTWNKQRLFTTSTGTDVYVGGSGVDNYGFLMDQGATTETLRNAILAKTTQTIEPTWIHKGWSRNIKNVDIGVTYIEISIGSQTMWFYRDNQLILSTPVVTGLPDGGGRDTPRGVFNAWAMSTNTRLTGSYGKETWDVVVNYWVSVDNNGVGIHDATWQPYFGGDRYLYGGSHGCINTPLDAMATLYNNLQQGTPIVIY